MITITESAKEYLKQATLDTKKKYAHLTVPNAGGSAVLVRCSFDKGYDRGVRRAEFC